MKKVTGFTITEVLIAMIIVALLLSAAIPTFNGALKKSRRTEAMASLVQLMSEQENYRYSNTAYAPSIINPLGGNLLRMSTLSSTGLYNISVSPGNSSVTYYIGVATAAVGKGQVTDMEGSIPCNVLTVDANNIRTPAACWTK